MNIVDMERNLTALLADLLGLVLDKTIIRGTQPLKRDGVAVITNNTGFPGSGPFTGCFQVQLLGNYQNRDAGLLLAEKIRAALPYRSPQWTIRLQGSVGIFSNTGIGRDGFGVSANLVVVCRC